MQQTIFAGIIGIAAIFLFMILYYRLPGFVATITLTVYLFLTLIIFDWMNVVLTLPGIAALILGVGTAVDANIITAERIREEIRVGKSIKSAFKAGNSNSISTVTDANLTLLLAAIVLFFYGTGAVKGFATSFNHWDIRKLYYKMCIYQDGCLAYLFIVVTLIKDQVGLA